MTLKNFFQLLRGRALRLGAGGRASGRTSGYDAGMADRRVVRGLFMAVPGSLTIFPAVVLNLSKAEAVELEVLAGVK